MKPEDAGDYTFVPDGYALSLSAKLNFLGERHSDLYAVSCPLMTVLIILSTLVLS